MHRQTALVEAQAVVWRPFHPPFASRGAGPNWATSPHLSTGRGSSIRYQFLRVGQAIFPRQAAWEIRAFTSLSVYGRFPCMGTAIEAGGPGVDPGTRSRILSKAREVGLSVPLDLERLAMARGCGYYERDLGPLACTAEGVPLSNAELAIALLAPSPQPTARQIRLAAALLGAADESAADAQASSATSRCAGAGLSPATRFGLIY